MSYVLKMEAIAASAANTKSLIPTPSDEDRKTLENMGVVFLEKFDKVLTQVKLPEDWYSKPQTDRRHTKYFRKSDEKEVMSTFLKNSGYDYYGYTCVSSQI